MSYQFITDLT